MHACGHDAHTSMLLAISRLLMDRRDEFAGTVKVLFQPAEEGGGGARFMIDEGVMEDPKVDAVFGMHMDQDSPVGTIGWVAGPAGSRLRPVRPHDPRTGRPRRPPIPLRRPDRRRLGDHRRPADDRLARDQPDPARRDHHRRLPGRRSPERDPGYGRDASHGPLVRPRGARAPPEANHGDHRGHRDHHASDGRPALPPRLPALGQRAGR